MKMTVKEYMKEHILQFDGGMGTLLQEAGLPAGELPERWNLKNPAAVTAIHRAYIEAGCHVLKSNTFGANLLKFSEEELETVVSAAFRNMRNAMEQAGAKHPVFLALDMGPTGRLLAPYGDLQFEDAVAIYAKTVELGVKYGADLILIETMGDSYETKAAVLAAKEHANLPIAVSNAYGTDGKLLTGATPEAMVAMLEGLRVDIIGANCSQGPQGLLPVAKRMVAVASTPVLLMPNAGLPHAENGKTVFDVGDKEFAALMAEAVDFGVNVVGGCCGTTPAHMKALSEKLKKRTPSPVLSKNRTVISSYTHAVDFANAPVLIGERINPTGKKRFRAALMEGDMDYLLSEGQKEQEEGAEVLDVNVGIPDIKEEEVLPEAVFHLQSVTDLPLQIDTSNPEAMERAMRLYNGKPMVNSVNGKEESMREVFPLLQKYGGVAVALTLDEGGIPPTAEGRLRIAEKILATAATYGIGVHELVFDPLAMTVSADANAALETLKAVSLIGEKLHANTSLGVSNVSFGLPQRDMVNSAFFTAALERGLSAAILNPYSLEMQKAYHTYLVLHGKDRNCEKYLAFSEKVTPMTASVSGKTTATEGKSDTLSDAIVKGRKERARELTAEKIKTVSPMDVVREDIIPALDTVGKGFEAKTVYLPQLLMSAEAAGASFEVVKTAMLGKGTVKEKCTVVLATVEGDIHDIGKNIVRLLLENYGFRVVDLGKNVPPAKVVAATLAEKAPLVGLSALMTTTVPAMETTIRELRRAAPHARIMVGGAVLNGEYAATIGADHYSPDAMDGVRYAEKIFASL